jgi:hypothetical protein
MNDGRAIRAILAASILAAGLTACRSPKAEPSAASRPTPPQPAAPSANSTAPHGDHNPHHGGVVMMKGELHYEVALDPAGRSHRLFFTDAVREDLPASIASSASLTIRRPGGADEVIALQIDSAGESWLGSGRPVDDPAQTTVRVAFTIQGEPYWIDVPFEARK